MQIMKVLLSSDALFQEISGEAVILDLASSKYFGLDGVGVRLWQLLGQNPLLQVACEQLLQEFDVPAEQLQQDVQALLAEMAKAGLVHVD